jgi:hypothetical protein
MQVRVESEIGRVLVNSVPKSGTNLLSRVLSLYPQIGFSGVHLGSRSVGCYLWRHWGISLHLFDGAREWFGKNELPVGVDLPHYSSKNSVHKKLSRVAPGYFATAHLPYSALALELLKELDYRLLIMIRDPRDVVVSLAHYVVRRRNHPLHRVFCALSQEERFLAAINGIEVHGICLQELSARFDSVLRWIDETECLVVRFEDLIGKAGGGSDRRQFAQILQIGAFLGLAHDDFDADYIARNAFSSSSMTFRKGQIGSWRDELGSEHVQAIKATVGHQLTALGYEDDINW